MPSEKALIAFVLFAAASAASAQDASPPASAPAASANALYCLRVEPALGSRLETVQCYTREQWAEYEVDLDKEWAKEGVRVIEA